MGLKAKIRELENENEMLKARLDTVYSCIKQLIITVGTEEIGKGRWNLVIPMFEVPEMVNNFEMITTVTSDGKLRIEVDKREEENDSD